MKNGQMNYDELLAGGLEHGWHIFPNSWDDDPIWRTHICQGGRYTTNQIINDQWTFPYN